MRKYAIIILFVIIAVCFSACTDAIEIKTAVIPHNIGITNAEDAADAEAPANPRTPDDTAAPVLADAAAQSNGALLHVHFIDVGQGDSIFAELPNGETMLIDGGRSEGIVLNYVKSLGYNQITYVIATHPDADHIGGLPEVLEHLQVQKFYMPEKEHTTKIFERMLDAVAANGCEAIYALAGKYLINSPDLRVYFVGPVKRYSDNNESSAVVKLEYQSNSFLFTGDAERISEADMIASGADIRADVLKVGHHGSASSTSEQFIQAVQPRIAVISVGNNSYGHPTQQVLRLLQASAVDIYRTDEAGTITISGDGTNYTIDKNKSAVQINAPPAAAVHTPQETPTAPDAADRNVQSAAVYRTKTGTKYHSGDCSYLKSKIEITLTEAKNMGLTPCARCNPPR